MARPKFDLSPVEPAHPMVVKLRDDLFAIYSHIRNKYQVQIDKAFDAASRQIGFVVTTTAPFKLEVGAKGSVMGGVIIDGSPLKDTIFERELTQVIKGFKGDTIPKVPAGTYHFHLIWFEALKLKLRTDWMEPAHVAKRGMETFKFAEDWIEQILRRTESRSVAVKSEVIEPVHWFDPGIAIAAEEMVMISVIDEVYPELRLADRIGAYRQIDRRSIRPEVKEPAHYRRIRSDIEPEKLTELLSELAAVLRKFGY